jgi:hypothetical protein
VNNYCTQDEKEASDGRVRELLRQYHRGDREDFRRAVELRAAERGTPVKVLVAQVALHHVHVVYEDGELWATRVEDIVLEVARRWIPIEFRVTVDSIADMGRKSLALIDANHKLHAENAALRQRVALQNALFSAVCVLGTMMVVAIVWKSVGQ